MKNRPKEKQNSTFLGVFPVGLFFLGGGGNEYITQYSLVPSSLS